MRFCVSNAPENMHFMALYADILTSWKLGRYCKYSRFCKGMAAAPSGQPIQYDLFTKKDGDGHVSLDATCPRLTKKFISINPGGTEFPPLHDTELRPQRDLVEFIYKDDSSNSGIGPCWDLDSKQTRPTPKDCAHNQTVLRWWMRRLMESGC